MVSNTLSFAKRKNRPKEVAELINADVCGPMQEKFIAGAEYFVCDFSKFRRVFFLKNKSEVVNCLKTFFMEIKTVGHTVKEFLISDNGKKFVNQDVKMLLESDGIDRTSVQCSLNDSCEITAN